MRSNPLKLVVTASCAAVVGVLAYAGAITTTIVPGVAALYPAAAVEVAFGIWFGLPGAIGSYIGLLIAGSLAGWFSIPVGAMMSVSDFLIAIIPYWAFRISRRDPSLPTWRDVGFFLLVSIFGGSLASSLYYNEVSLRLGVLPSRSAYWTAVIGWNIGNVLILSFIGIPLLRTATKFVVRAGLMSGQKPSG